MHRPAIVLACLLAGCAVSHVPIDESPHAFVDAWFDAQCELALRCEYVTTWGVSRDESCHPSARARWSRLADGVSTGEVRFDGARAVACVEALRSSECVVSLEAMLPREICRGVLAGIAPVGTACELDGLDACDDGLGCEPFSACPRCVPGGAAGEWCVGPSYACADGLQCIFFSTGPSVSEARCGNERFAGEPCVTTDFCRSEDPRVFSTCVDGACAPTTAVALGAECGAWLGNCPAESYCGVDRALHPDGDVPYTCLPFRALGESCAGASCAPGLRCDMGTCASIGALGDSCTNDEECGNDAPYCSFHRCGREVEGTRCRQPEITAPVRNPCPDDLVCMRAGWCLRPVALGAPCNGLFEVCGEDARCVDEVCTAIVRPGGSCESTDVCPPLHQCSDGRCTPLPTVGEPCRDACHNAVCREGRCAPALEPLREGEACDGELWGSCASPLGCVREDDGGFRCRARSCE